MLLNTCYQPTEWDIYWRLEPCHFVMDKLEKEQKLFGTPAVPAAWLRAISHHPLAYLEHRASFMWNFLAGANLTMWTADIEKPDATVFPDRAAFGAVKAVHDWLKPTPLFRAGTWLHRLSGGLRLRLAPARNARRRLCHRRCRLGRALCADLLRRRRRVRFPLRLLGGARRHRRQRRRRAA